MHLNSVVLFCFVNITYVDGVEEVINLSYLLLLLHTSKPVIHELTSTDVGPHVQHMLNVGWF